MERTLYYASVGPITWNDEEPVSAPSDLFVGMNRVALITDSYVLAAGFGYLDTDGTHFLTINWNEDATANRTLSFVLGDGNRTLTMNEDFTIGDGNAGTLTFSAASKTLTVENNAVVSQDYSSDSTTVAFASLALSSLANAGVDADKFLVLDGSSNVDYRVGTEVASDIDAVVSIPVSGEYEITNIRLDASKRIVVTYNETPEP